ncbi:hypothetical protein MRB53_038453 [Persea americana]|nr:hypothetical protein MRB53_038453 [Persea americana]
MFTVSDGMLRWSGAHITSVMRALRAFLEGAKLVDRERPDALTRRYHDSICDEPGPHSCCAVFGMTSYRLGRIEPLPAG